MAGPTKPKSPVSDQDAVLRQLLEDATSETSNSLQKPAGPRPVERGPVREVVDRGRGTAKAFRGFGGALYDSRLFLHGSANADLMLFLRILFRRVDPTPKGGRQESARDGNGTEYKLEEINDQDFLQFRRDVCKQAARTWRGLCLVTPNDYDGLDFPKPRPSVRPNVECFLHVEFTEDINRAHAVIDVVAPSYPKNFISFVHGATKGTWDINDTGRQTRHAAQDPAFWWFNKEDLHQTMVPHEIGHLIGLDHIGLTLNSPARQAGKCLFLSEDCSAAEARGKQYGDHKAYPMWMARDIMGLGDVVHACNCSPWAHAMAQHTNVPADDWMPAGTSIPPRALKDIPRQKYTLRNSPYQGGFQERDRY